MAPHASLAPTACNSRAICFTHVKCTIQWRGGSRRACSHHAHCKTSPSVQEDTPHPRAVTHPCPHCPHATSCRRSPPRSTCIALEAQDMWSLAPGLHHLHGLRPRPRSSSVGTWLLERPDLCLASPLWPGPTPLPCRAEARPREQPEWPELVC